jgi:hypothetical protein
MYRSMESDAERIASFEMREQPVATARNGRT